MPISERFLRLIDDGVSDAFAPRTVRGEELPSRAVVKPYRDVDEDDGVDGRFRNSRLGGVSAIMSAASDCTIPEWKNGTDIYKCPVLLSNQPCTDEGLRALNHGFGYCAEKRAGFVLCKKAVVIAFSYLPNRNRDGHYGEVADKLLDRLRMVYRHPFRLPSGGTFQLLDGRACSVVFPVLENFRISDGMSWQFIGERG